jgi:hypothetical protein
MVSSSLDDLIIYGLIIDKFATEALGLRTDLTSTDDLKLKSMAHVPCCCHTIEPCLRSQNVGYRGPRRDPRFKWIIITECQLPDFWSRDAYARILGVLSRNQPVWTNDVFEHSPACLQKLPRNRNDLRVALGGQDRSKYPSCNRPFDHMIVMSHKHISYHDWPSATPGVGWHSWRLRLLK